MADVWLTKELTCELAACSARHAERQADSGAWKTRMSESRGANGKQEREYLLASLPAAAQLKYAQKENTAIVKAAPTAETLPLFANVPEALPELARLAVPAEFEAQARARYAAIEPLLDFRRRTNGHRPTFHLAGGRRVSNLNELAEYIAAQQHPPVSSGTIWRWLRSFSKGGYAALADRARADKGRSRFFEEHPAASAFLQNKFLDEGLSRQMAWEAMVREWKKIERRGAPPSYGTARTYLNAIPDPAKTLAREGPRAYESKCSPFLLRGKTPCAAMDWWVADHRQFDVLVRNTLFGTMPAEQAYRPWLTAVYDWGSRKLHGFCFAPTPSSRTISSALRLAILSHGFPRNFYWDNGKDFKKVRDDLELITLSTEAKSLFDGRGIGITSALPFHPRSKPIESWFSRWSKRFDVMWKPAYLGNKPGNCPQAGREAQMQHALYQKAKRSDSPLPSDAEFILATMQWIEEYNGTRLESLEHRTPLEVMEEQWPERNRPQIDARLLDILFSEREKRIVQQGGCVQLDSMRYEPTDLSLCAMDFRRGRKVMILRDPYNLGEAVAADPETLQFIGELRIQQFVAQCPNGQISRDQIQAGMRRQRSLKRGYAEYLATLSAIAQSQGWQTEREALLERAGVRTGTDNQPALPAAAVPGAQRALPASHRAAPISPFVDDAAKEFIEAMKEQS